jgi:uncharacterized protein YndB with AHSA1/START domain
MLWTMHVTRSVVLETAVDETWELLADPDELEAWLGHRVEVDRIVPGQRMSFVWSDDDRPPSRVELVVEAVGERTRLTVTEAPVAHTSARASVAGGIARLPIGAQWGDRMLDLELRCLALSRCRV